MALLTHCSEYTSGLDLRYWYPTTTSKRRILHACLLTMWILLVLSTMVIKQHYIWDVATALLLTALGWVYWMKPNLERLKTDEGNKQFDELMLVD